MGPPGEIRGGVSLGTKYRAGSWAGYTPSTAWSFGRRAALAQTPVRSLQDVDHPGESSRIQLRARVVGFPVPDHAIVRRHQSLFADAGGDDLRCHGVTDRAKDRNDLVA